MILQISTLRIVSNAGPTFEAAFHDAELWLPELEGYVTHELQCSLTDSDAYVLLIEWVASCGGRPQSAAAAYLAWQVSLQAFCLQISEPEFFGLVAARGLGERRKFALCQD